MKNFNMGRRVALLSAIALTLIGVLTPGAQAQSLKEQVEKEGKLTIGISNTWPWGFKDEGGVATGIYPDALREATQKVGVKNVDFVIMEWGALIPSLLSRRIDAIAAGMAITVERCKQVSFSDPVEASRNSALVKKGNPLNIHGYVDMAKNPNVRVGDIRGASTTEDAIAAGVPKDRIQLFQDQTAGLAAILAGRVDALLMSGGTIAGMLKDPNVKGLERATPFQGLIVNGKEKIDPSAIAFRPQDAEFRDLFNKSLAQVKADGTVEKIMLKYGFTKDDLAPTGLTAKDVCKEEYR